MRTLLSLILILSSLCSYAQSELPGDTIKNRLPVIKEQVPSVLKKDMPPNRNGAFSEEQPELNYPMDRQDSVTLHVTPPEYIEPLPWADMEKMPFKSNPFDMDYERYANFLLSPEVILDMYSTYNTYPTMGSIMEAGAGITYYSPNERWELSGGVYASKYTLPSRMHGAQMDLGLNASIAYRINDRIRIRAFGQYSGFGKSNSLNGYMNPMYRQSAYGIVMEVKISNHFEIHGGMERVYDPTKMKWTMAPMIYPVFRIGK